MSNCAVPIAVLFSQPQIFYWNSEQIEDIQAWSVGKVSMLSAWAGNDVGTSTWLVSVQFQNSAKGIWGKQGHGEHSSLALQGGNPHSERHYQLLLQCIQTHSRESLAHPGIWNSSKMTWWWMLRPLFHPCPSPPVARGKGASFLQNAGIEPFHPRVHGEWQSRASAWESGWNTDTCPQMHEVKWNFSQ